MAYSLLGFGRAGGMNNAGITSSYAMLGTAGLSSGGTEAYNQTTTRSPGAVCSRLCVNVITNTQASDATVTFRVNGSDGNQVITITANTTGWFADTTHSDVLNNGDVIGIKFATANATGNVIISVGVMLFSYATGLHSYFVLHSDQDSPGIQSSTTGSVTYTGPIGGGLQGSTLPETTETNRSKVTLRAAGTLSNFNTYLRDTSNRANPSTLGINLNGAPSNQSILITNALSVDKYEDLTNSDGVISGTTADFYLSNGAGSSGSFNLSYFGAKFASAANNFDLVSCSSDNSGSCQSNATYFALFGNWGVFGGEITESKAQTKMLCGTTFSRMRCAVTTNSVGIDLTVTFRKNGIAGNQTFTIPANTTGIFEDTTHNDTVVDGDLVDYQLSATGVSSGLVIPWLAITADTTISSLMGQSWT